MWNNCKIISVPTDDTNAPVLRNTYCFKKEHGNAFISSKGIDNAIDRGYEYQHLYILSNDVIKEGDWYWDTRGFKKCKGEFKLYTCQKVIATTDPNLNYELVESGVVDESTNTKELMGELNIPFIPELIVDEWIKEQFDNLDVEYEEYMTDGWIPSYGNPDNSNLDEPAEIDYRAKHNDGYIVSKLNKERLKIYKAEFNGVNPVGNCLVLAAYNQEQAEDMAQKTITHTNHILVNEITVDKPQIIEYLSGDY